MASRLFLLLSICLLHQAACRLPDACTSSGKTLSCMFDLTDLSFLATLQDGGENYETLSISLNDGITTVNRNTFSNPIFQNVVTLTFDFNEIATIQPDAFKGLKNLKSLMLNNNKIPSLKEKMFNGLEKLNYAKFGRNEISSIDSKTFQGLINLKNLDLSNNRLTSINKDIFQYLPALFFLDISSNQISALGQNNFHGLSLLFSLDLHNNQISQIHPQSLEGLESVFNIKLGGNPIGSLDAHLFKPTTDLRLLDLTNATFKNVPHINSSSIHILNLPGCSLNRLPTDFFGDLPNIENIDLSNNGITSFPQGIFRGLTELSRLNLDSNLMKTISVSTFEELYLKNGEIKPEFNITLTNNPWDCGHSGLKATLAWVKQKKVNAKFPCNSV